MARLTFGYMVLLLTCSKIASANVLPAPDELNEKLNLNGESDSTYTRISPTINKYSVLPSVEQSEDANKFAKRSIEDGRGNQINFNNYYSPSLRQAAPEVAPHPYSFFSLLQPQHHQINRPYYIPVLRGPGGSTIILPPQPLDINFQHPPDNPPINSYLPPVNQTPRPCSNSTPVDTGSRFGTGTPGPVTPGPVVTPPVWGVVTSEPAIPTRRPGGQSTTPPSLIHNLNDGDNELSNSTPATTTTTAAARPPSTKLPPSTCVWSIVSCCNSESAAINYRCFEGLGCEGAFWDGSPCDTPFAKAALENIKKYYAL